MIIRSWRPEDAAALARAINDEAVQANLRDGLPFPYTVSDAEAFIGFALSAGDGMYSFAVTENDVCIGSISVTRGENIHRLTGELGYYIARERWGRGYATRAVREICRYVFENTDIVRICAEPFADNAASCRVLEKAGFTLEGTLRANAIKSGRIRDTRIYSLLRE